MSRYTVRVDGSTFQVELKSRVGSVMTLSIDGEQYEIDISSDSDAQLNSKDTKRPSTPPRRAKSSSNQPSDLKAPIPGIVSEIKVSPGTEVKAGDVVVVIEAMKMENPLKAAADGVVESVLIEPGQEVLTGAVLVRWRNP
jgi:biotin carboxyl carrier protein